MYLQQRICQKSLAFKRSMFDSNAFERMNVSFTKRAAPLLLNQRPNEKPSRTKRYSPSLQETPSIDPVTIKTDERPLSQKMFSSILHCSKETDTRSSSFRILKLPTFVPENFASREKKELALQYDRLKKSSRLGVVMSLQKLALPERNTLFAPKTARQLRLASSKPSTSKLGYSSKRV